MPHALAAVILFCTGAVAASAIEAGGWVSFWSGLLSVAIAAFFIVVEGQKNEREQSR